MSEGQGWDRKLGYERPHERWHCARRAAGRPSCGEGPTPQGSCGGSTECRPALRGDGWVCMRGPARGGDCEQGPLPDGTCCRPVSRCQPRRSQRVLRGLVVRRTVLVVVALASLALLGGSRERWLSPGPLSREHASLGGSGPACSACHAGAVGLPLIGSSGEAAAHGTVAREGSCLGCHDFGAAARSPHSLSPGVLAGVTAAAKDRRSGLAQPAWLGLVQGLVAPEQAREPSCSTCHQEHGGMGSSVLDVDDGSCGACHVAQFRSLAEGHPDFVGFPLSAKRVDGPTRARTRLAFDHSKHLTVHFPEKKAEFHCVACHVLDGDGRNLGVVDSEQSCGTCHGSDVVSGELVLLALPNLDARSLSAAESGSWPRTSRKKRPVELLHLLLLGDPALDAGLAEALRSGAIDDSNDLSRIRDAESAALAVEMDWATKRLVMQLAQGDSAATLGRLAGLSTDGGEVDPRLLGGLSQDLLGPAAESWFPRLDRELALREDLLAQAEVGAVGTPEPDAPADSDSPPAPEPKVAPDEAASPGEPSGLAALAVEQESADGWWSARGKEGLTSGGWYREDRNTLVAYRPTGHGDPVLAAWIEQVSRLPEDSEPAKKLALTLLDPVEGPGRCTKCHTLDGEGAQLVVNWRGAAGDDEQGSFTVFRHGPHVRLLGDDAGCESCHSLDRTRLVAEEGVFAGRDPSVGGSSFLDVDRATCVSCHVPEGAGDSCTGCHRYHLGAPAASAAADGRVAGLR